MTRILVIKLGALGDFVQALGPMMAIRRHHADAHITLLTTKPYAALAAATGYVDTIWIDERPSLINLVALWTLRRQLRGGQFDRVYDLQTSDRSGWYFRLLGPMLPEWSGIVRGCSHPHRNPGRDLLHTVDRQAEQLRDAGITDIPPPNFDWAKTDLSRFALQSPYIVLIPGGSSHRLAKRWPVSHYAALARHIQNNGFQPIILGSAAEAALADDIVKAAPATRNLMGQTNLIDLATLGRGAFRAIGNDTGPTHLVAAAGAPTTVLYSAASDPALTAPRGPDVHVLRRNSLADLHVDEVADTLRLG